MLSKAKFRRKARRIAISEIMIPIILLIVLGITTLVLILKLTKSDFEEIFTKQERIEIKWVINLGVVMTYSVLDLTLAFFVYTGIKEKSYWKCNFWVYLQLSILFVFTLAVMKRCSAAIGGIHFFEFIVLCISIYIYKVHHITFVYGLLDDLKPITKINYKRRRTREIRQAGHTERITPSITEKVFRITTL